MTTYVFHGERVRLPTRFTCSCCGKTGRTRTITVEHTVNPFNKNADGTVKSRSEVRADARAEAVLRRAKFLTEPWCKSCEDDLSYSDGKALRERRNANHQNTVDDLRAARALIDTPEKWVRDTWSRPSDTSPTGRCFCALGAAKETTGWGGLRSSRIERLLNDAVPATFVSPDPDGRPVVMFNDDPATTHNDILALFDRAIQRAETTPSNDQQNEREQT